MTYHPGLRTGKREKRQRDGIARAGLMAGERGSLRSDIAAALDARRPKMTPPEYLDWLLDKPCLPAPKEAFALRWKRQVDEARAAAETGQDLTKTAAAVRESVEEPRDKASEDGPHSGAGHVLVFSPGGEVSHTDDQIILKRAVDVAMWEAEKYDSLAGHRQFVYIKNMTDARRAALAIVFKSKIDGLTATQRAQLVAELQADMDNVKDLMGKLKPKEAGV